MLSKPLFESKEDKLFRISTNFDRRKVQTVSDASHYQYNVGARAWFRFCSETGLNVNMSIIHESMLHLSLMEYQTKVMGSFMSFLSEDEKIHPNSVANYVSGLKDYAKREHMDLSYIDQITIKQMQKAINLDWTNTHSEKSDSAKMPFTLDMIAKWINLTNFNDTLQFSLVLTAMLQFSQIMRIGEVLPQSLGKYHFLRAKDVQFEFSCERYGNGKNTLIPAFQITTAFSLDNLIAVHIRLRSAKNDTEGHGFKYTHPNIKVSDKRVYNLAEMMFKFSIKAQPLSEDPFISYESNSSRRYLNYSKYNSTIKSIAKSFGFNTVNFASHSLRIGGTTLLAAAEYPDSYIKKMGRWKSDCYLKYIHFDSISKMRIEKSLCDPTIFTMSDMMSSNPSAI